MFYVLGETFLNKIGIGDEAVIEECLLQDNLKGRGLDFGIIEGAMIKCVGESALGDPKAYSIGGTMFALRKTDAMKIMVRCIK